MITVRDVAYVRYQAPDLAAMERFLVDFGMHKIGGDERVLYMRGYGSQPCIHITEHGAEARALGFGMLAQSAADLHKLAAAFGVAVLDNLEPGGGQVVTVRDPDGMQVDVLYGQQPAPPMPVRAPLQLNAHTGRQRFGAVQRLRKGPSHVMRLGHVVLNVADLNAATDFYQKNFGFKVSDGYYIERPEQVVARFMRCGLGKAYTDHHTVALIASPKSGFEHTAFEVLDWDDLQIGNGHLLSRQYVHSWGIGRHIEGSQVFDYWRDPFDNKIEHWTDGDLVNDGYVGGAGPLGPEALSQWGPPITSDFMR